jgi:B-block binding subunit of TFIIIC.
MGNTNNIYNNQLIYKSFFNHSLRKKNYDTCVNSRKPGPKDGWYGLTLKILNYIAKRNGCSIKDLCKVFNIARQNIHYHINKLVKLGLIERYPPNAKKHNPCVIYIPNCRREKPPFFFNISSSNSLNGSSSKKAPALKKKSYQIIEILSIRPQTPRMLREKLQMKERTLRYYINKLIKSGQVVRAGGRNCKYAYLVLSPKPVFLQHSHKFTKYHRYHKNRRIPFQKKVSLKNYSIGRPKEF